MRLEITDFIQSNPDWEEKLAAAPFFVKTKRNGDFVLLKYDQLRSDFSLPMVRECRGIILDGGNAFRPVCVPFFKFGNFGETYVPEIDWNTARVQEKLDGSIIKLWHHQNRWHISSNGEIDARNACINSALLIGREVTNLYSLFMEAWDKTGVNMDNLDTKFTYLFELTSPHNRIVVRYNDVSICHIGTRDNVTFEECDIDLGIIKPKVFPLNSLNECIEAAKQLGYNNEGYVVVDGFYNRVKVKSPLYVTLNHLVQGVTTRGKIVEIIQKNEQAEFLTYFPEYREAFNAVVDGIEAFSKRQHATFADIKAIQFDSRKAMAAVVTKEECPPCLFSLLDGKETDAREWLLARPPTKVLALIALEE